jgi:hypothetical protein
VSTKPKELVVELFVGGNNNYNNYNSSSSSSSVVSGVLGKFQLECMILSRPWNINSPHSS